MKLIPTSVTPVTITLYQGVPFDNSYNEHTLFNPNFKYQGNDISYDDNEAFLDYKVNGNYKYPRTIKSGTYNFAFGNGLVTSVVMELTDNEINSNYMKVSTTASTSESSVDYYYFITGITQRNEVTYIVNLELDVFQTFGGEFLDNIQDIPVMVERKHCRRVITKKVGSIFRNFVNPICFNQESTFSKFKANIVNKKEQLGFADFIRGVDDFNAIMNETLWCYVIVGKGYNVHGYNFTDYEENGITYPYGVMCFPLRPTIFIDGDNDEYYLSPAVIMDEFVKGQASVQKIIISPFPPFNNVGNMIITDANDTLHIKVGETAVGNIVSFMTGTNGSLINMVFFEQSQDYMVGVFSVGIGYGGKFNYKPSDNYFDTTIPTITSNKDVGEWKLQIAPFKELRLSSFYGMENVVSPQYKFLQHLGTTDWNKIKCFTIASSNPENNTYYDTANINGNEVEMKQGVSSSVAYSFPTGTDAELLYEQTAKNQYENSKMVNAISNGLKILGGIGAVALSPSPVGVIAGGIALASGVTGEISNITEWGAKLEDLRNTPNSYNFAGSALSIDLAIQKSTTFTCMLPYLIQYKTSEVEYHIANDFLYHFGYEYNMMCYFNYKLYPTSDDVFNRTIFNYVKIREDVTGKIVGDNLPLIVAKKINEVLNAGITFWTFFNCESLEEGTATVGSYDVYDYFHKDTYANAEVVSADL